MTQLDKNIIIMNDFFCEKYIIDIDLLKSNIRVREAVYARFFCWHYLRVHSNLSLAAIGKKYNRTHDTVLFGLRKLNELLESDKYMLSDKVKYDKIMKELFDKGYIYVPTSGYSSLRSLARQKKSLMFRSGIKR